LKFKADFHSKMSVCGHELGGRLGDSPPPWQFQSCNSPTSQTERRTDRRRAIAIPRFALKCIAR